jgi:hypothetical protein
MGGFGGYVVSPQKTKQVKRLNVKMDLTASSLEFPYMVNY